MKPDFSLARAQARYARLLRQLSAVGWISEGYAQNRGPGLAAPVINGRAKSQEDRQCSTIEGTV